MNDAADTAGAGPNFEPLSSVPPDERTFGYWMKRLLACNPFYLVSAALLLYGLYRVSVDPAFLSTEVRQLVFNFTSLQFYELLLVGTAIVLARRLIWYDSGLLLVLENLFALVPFFLISQAALIEQRLVWFLCIFTALLIVARWSAARWHVSFLKLSPWLLVAGAMVVVANGALVIAYRIFQETKAGKGIPAGAAYWMNEASWMWLLPTLCALAILLPRRHAGGKLRVQRSWFPVTLFLTWIVATGVHLYALGYVYDFPLRRDLIAPVLCALAWVIHFRLKDFVPTPSKLTRIATPVWPTFAALLAVNVEGRQVFFALMLLNTAGFIITALLDRENRVARHLAFASLVMAVTVLPPEWATWLGVAFGRSKFFAMAAIFYVLLRAALSRDPKVALLGAFAAAIAAGALREPSADYLHWAAQAGIVFFLLHSLRWEDYYHDGAVVVRFFFALAWGVHAFFWVREGAMFWQPLLPAALVAAGWWFRGLVFRNWSAPVLPVMSAIVALCQPISFALKQAQQASLGVVAIGASFVLFAVGTTVALTKHRWHPHREQ